jgi:hypothetical protein
MSLTADIPDAFFSEVLAYAARRWPTEPEAPEWMLKLMMSESGMYATAKNSIGCGGIIGFCPPFPGGVDPSTLSHVEQMKLAEGFWNDPRLDYIEDGANLYQFNFVPASLARGTGLGTVIVARGGTGYGGAEGAFYDANPALDVNRDGKITVGDLMMRLNSAQVAGSARYKEARARMRALPLPGGFTAGAAIGLVAVGGAALLVTAAELATSSEVRGARELRSYAKGVFGRAAAMRFR